MSSVPVREPYLARQQLGIPVPGRVIVWVGCMGPGQGARYPAGILAPAAGTRRRVSPLPRGGWAVAEGSGGPGRGPPARHTDHVRRTEAPRRAARLASCCRLDRAAEPVQGLPNACASRWPAARRSSPATSEGSARSPIQIPVCCSCRGSSSLANAMAQVLARWGGRQRDSARVPELEESANTLLGWNYAIIRHLSISRLLEYEVGYCVWRHGSN